MNQNLLYRASPNVPSGHRLLRFLAVVGLLLLIQTPSARLHAASESPANGQANSALPTPAAENVTAQNGMALPTAFQGVWSGSLTLGPDDTLEVLMTLTNGTVDSVVGMIAFSRSTDGCVEALELQAVNNSSIDLKTDTTTGTYFGECIASDYRLTLSADGTLFYEEFINRVQRASTNLTRINAADTTTHAGLSSVWRGAVTIDGESVPVLLTLANGSSGNIAGTIAFDGDTLCIEAMELNSSASDSAELTTAAFAGACQPSLYKLSLEADGTLSYEAFVAGALSGTGSLIKIGISFAISGRITDASNRPIADVIIYDDAGHTTLSLRDGTYTLSGLAPGRYTLIPFLSGQTFTPDSLVVDVPPDSSGQNFTTGVVDDTARTIDVIMSLYDNPSTADERDAYEQVIGFFADGVFEATNGAHTLGQVTIYTNGAYADQSHIQWDTQTCRAHAQVSGYGRKQAGAHVMMCGPPDWHSYVDAGYVLAHEWGHYYYSLYDEYREEGWPCEYFLRPSQPCDDDQAVANSIMHNQYKAVDGDYAWLNFSTARNITRNNAQYRMYAASAWETLARPPSMDPRNGTLSAYPERLYYSELADFAPASGQDPAIDLTSNHTARNNLSISWRDSFAMGAILPDNRLAMLQSDTALSLSSARSTQPAPGTVHQIVIDVSAGMVADNKLDDVKQAAQWLVDQAVIGSDAVGVTIFDADVTVLQPITLLDSVETRDLIKSQIDAIQPGQIDAAMGEAARQALQELLQFAPATNTGVTNRNIYLITGSSSRQGVPPLAVLGDYTAAGMPLHTIGYGVDPTTSRVLEVLAGETKGTYHFIPAPDDTNRDRSLTALIAALNDILRGSAPIVSTNITLGTTLIAASANVALPVIVDSTLDTLELAVSYDTATPVDLQLLDPANTPAAAATCTATGAYTNCLFRVTTPNLRVGTWTLQARAGNTPVQIQYRATGLVQGKPTFMASIESLDGNTILYPDPLVLRAVLQKQLPIAKAIITATVTLPDKTIQPLILRDDGTTPDREADDGAYSAILDYGQDGTYTINVQFDNSANTAEETNRGVAFAPGDGETDIPDPKPVGENFMRVAQIRVQITGVRADDHGDTPQAATQLFADNTDISGRIDRAGDKDVFGIPAPSDGQVAVRISSLALDMLPRLRLFAADGSTVLKEVEFVPDKQEYLYTLQSVKAGDMLYAEVSQLDETAPSGRYAISAGPALSQELTALPWLLIGSIASGVLVLGIIGAYLFTRRRRSSGDSGSDATGGSGVNSIEPGKTSRSGSRSERKPPSSADTESGATTKD